MPVSEELWKEYHLRLRSFVQGRIGDPSVTEDTVQEVFTRIHSLLDIFDPKTYRERRQVARRCESTLELGVRTCVDTLDDRVSRSYVTWPARIYPVGVDGKIVYRGRPGPSGFQPDELRKAIDEYLEKTDSSWMTDPLACRLRETSK